jgi:hypothetical protein
VTETLDERAERLLRVGLDIAVRIREDMPADVRRGLDGLDPSELRDLVTLLAAVVPVDVPESALLAWYTHPRYQASPCGTLPAARRHQRLKEPLDPLCALTLQERDRLRKRNERADPPRRRRPVTA